MSEVGTKAEYGEFNHNKRYFTVVTAGIYKFDFTGLVLRTNGSCKHHFQLQVDGVVKSECQANSKLMELQRVSLSSVQQLNAGQKVSIIRVSGGLYEASNNVSPATFSCMLIAGN